MPDMEKTYQTWVQLAQGKRWHHVEELLSGLDECPQRSPGLDLDSEGTRRPPEAARSRRPELKDFYRSYIHAVNANLSESALAVFVQGEVVHNGRCLSLSQYVGLIDQSSSAFHDMTAAVVELYAGAEQDADIIIARLAWSGTLKTALQGVEPNGNSATFSEVVFYKLELGRIKRVWSVVDWDAFRAQMSREGD